MGTVRLTGVHKSYGQTAAVRGVTFDIAEGEFVVLVGPSGCGKSTLLRMIAGLEPITAGTVEIAGRVVNDVPAKDRDIAMVFQSYALYPHMHVFDNMAFSLRMQRVPKAEMRARIERAAAILGLSDLLGRYPRELSGGQRQRVAMGRAIVRDPAVFLFDEPLSNLDAKLRTQMRTEIKDLHQRLRTTTVYVTHDQIEAMTLADRIVVMHDGVVEQVGAPLELFDRPRNAFVAGFIGSPAMNLLPGRIEGRGVALDGGPTVPLPDLPAGWSGRPVLFGVRPEHLVLADGGVPFRAAVVEPTGSETQIVARGGVDVVVVLRERRPVRPGDELPLAVAPGCAHLFDPDSGLRLDAADGALPARASA
jgi:multiple sugar transport system ATP-binding protein